MLVGTMMHTHRCIRCITMGNTDINNICTCLYVTFLHFSPFHVFLSVFLRVSPCVSMSLLTRSEDALHPELIQLVVVGGGDHTAAHNDDVFSALRLELGEERGDQCTVPRRLGTHPHHVHLGKESRSGIGVGKEGRESRERCARKVCEKGVRERSEMGASAKVCHRGKAA